MRLLHTSDWHLGQCLHQFDRAYEHDRFLAWLLATLVAEEVDALLIAGDVFDSSNPPASAQARFYEFLSAARQRLPGLSIVIAAGNHDSPGRLEAPAPLLARFGASVVGAVSRSDAAIDLERLLVPLKDRHGDVGAWCIAMPYLRPGDVPRVEESENPHQAGIAALYQSAFAFAQERRQAGQAIVAMGHCHLTGGQVSEASERCIVIGGVEALPASIFDPNIAYVALGHLHLAQTVARDTTRRYCGSPLPLSFAEVDYPHQVVLVDLAGESVASVRELRVPRSVDLLRIPARPAPVEQVLAELTALDLQGRVEGAECTESAWPYLLVRVQLSAPEPGLRALIDEAIAGKPLRLARIETSYAAPGKIETAPAISIDELNALAPLDFFERLYQHRFGAAAPAELLAAFGELLETANADEVQA